MTWLSADWSYRKSHVINAATGAGTLYPKQITVHFGSGADNDDDVYCNSHCKADFGDIRFTDNNGTTLLDYYMGSYESGTSALFWVKIADSLETDPQTIYVYYDNSDVSSIGKTESEFFYVKDYVTAVGVAGNYGNRAYYSEMSKVQGPPYLSKLMWFKMSCLHQLGSSGNGFKIISYERVDTTKWHTKYKSAAFTLIDGTGVKYDLTPDGLNLDMFCDASDYIGYYSPSNGLYARTICNLDPANYATTSGEPTVCAEVTENLYTGGWWVNCGGCFRKYTDPEPAHGAWGNEESSISGERFDVKVYRDGELVFDDVNEVVSFELERSVTSERSEARIRFDGGSISPTAIQENDAIIVWIASSGIGALTKVFSGEVDEVNRVREEGEPFIDVIAHDWSKLLSERKINLSYPSVTNISEIAGTIVEPISSSGTVGYNERKVTTNNIETMSKTRTIDFIGLTMYEALAKLSDYTLCDFYVDEEKDLNWFLRGSRTSGKSLDEEDLQNYEYITDRDVCNQVKVFGAPNRTDPEFNLDAYSDSLDNWDSEAVGGGGTITTDPHTASTFTAEASPGWTRHKGHGIIEEDLDVDLYILDRKEWTTGGLNPWIDASMYNYIQASVGDDLHGIGYWSLENPSSAFTNLVEGDNSIASTLRIYGYFNPAKTSIWYAPCVSSSEFTAVWGNYTFETSGGEDEGAYLRLWCNESSPISEGYKTFDEETGNMRVNFWIRVPPEGEYQNGDKLYLLYLEQQYSGELLRTIAQIYIEKVSDVWRWRLKGRDKNNNLWTVETTYTMSTNTWLHVYLDLDKGGTANATATFRDASGTIIAQETGIDLTDCRVKRVRARAEFSPLRKIANIVSYDEIVVTAAKRAENFNARVYSQLLQAYVTYPFTFYDTMQDLIFIDLSTTSSFNTYDQLAGAYLYFDMVDSTGITGAGGSVIIYYAYLKIFADCYTGQGSPYISDDDGDEDYIEATSPTLLEDKAWKNFGFSLAGYASCEYVKIYVKGRKVGGTDATSRVMVKDATTGSWIDLSDQTWTSETYTTKEVDATAYINTRYNIEHLEIGFKKIGGTGTIRITYAYVEVKYLEAESLMTLDPLVKKTGIPEPSYSIKLYWGGVEGSGTIGTTVWRTFNPVIACQTPECKEGFTELVFASLIDMSVWSDLDHWRRPAAKLAEFTVYLYDNGGNKIGYAASDLYPTSSFMATPGPSETKMKEIHVAVGSDSEADGKWEMITGTSFDWTTVNTVEFFIQGVTDTEVEGNPYLEYLILWTDWLHWESGRWFAEYELADDSYSVLTYGRSYNELFDKTCFSYEDCYMKAKYYAEKNKYPIDYLENVEIDYQGMETLNPGEMVDFSLPEGTLCLRINQIKWIWDGNLYGALKLDNEGLKTVVVCPTGEQILNKGFETGAFTNWSQTDMEIVTYDPHTGTYNARALDSYPYLGNIEQTFSTPFAGNCVTSATFWSYGGWSNCPAGGTKFTVRVTYDDDDYDELEFETTYDNRDAWTENNFLSIIDTSKNIKKIKISIDRNNAGTNNKIDDVSVYC